MRIGVPKEIKTNENRVALTPAGALELTKRGHEVFVQSTAGDGRTIIKNIVPELIIWAIELYSHTLCEEKAVNLISGSR